MLVLIDLEWTIRQNQEKELTQISAVRVDQKWNIHSEFHRTIRPEAPAYVDWLHVAYNGYSQAYFLDSPEEAFCLAEFADWLQEDDALCSWAYSVKVALKEIWLREFGQKLKQKVRVSNTRVYDQLPEINQGLYPIAQQCGLPLLHPEHCAKNDAYMMLAVFRVFFAQPDVLCKKRIISKAKRNAALLRKTNYNYVYTPTSGIFHRPICKRILQANKIIGCELYKTACKRRRPCKSCSPMPPEPARPVAPAAQKPTPPTETLQSIRLFDQNVILTYPHKIVGCCHNQIHPGKMTRKLMQAHDCLGKQCRYFEKYESSTYWAEQEQKQKQRQAQKEQKRQAKEAGRAAQTKALEIVDALQDYADLCGYDIDIIAVKQERKNLYKVFYVSEHTYPDGQLYAGLIELARQEHPKWRLLLRHIKDENGRFVTFQTFYARKRT